MAEPLLRLDDIAVDFDGFKAIDHLTFTVMPQEHVRNSVETSGSPELVVYAAWA